jgi:hypothetical protein
VTDARKVLIDWHIRLSSFRPPGHYDVLEMIGPGGVGLQRRGGMAVRYACGPTDRRQSPGSARTFTAGGVVVCEIALGRNAGRVRRVFPVPDAASSWSP